MKSISSDNYNIRPFRANKSWAYLYTHRTSGVTGSDIRIDSAIAPPLDWNTFSVASTKNDDNIYKETLYKSVQWYFYTGSQSDPSKIIELSPRNKKYYPTGSEFYVVNVAQRRFGENIKPGSFSITAANSTASLYDDGSGRIVSSTATGSIIGSIFYGSGIIVLSKDTGSYSSSLVTDRGLYLATGSQVTIEFDGLQTIYEHEIICTVEPGELNYSTNRTLQSNSLSGSYSGSVFYSNTGSLGVDLIFSGTLEPYFTTIGLYNDSLELIAIAKVPRPIKRIINTQQTVIVRFDA